MKHLLNTIAVVTIAFTWVLFLIVLGYVDAPKYQSIAFQKIDFILGVPEIDLPQVTESPIKTKVVETPRPAEKKPDPAPTVALVSERDPKISSDASFFIYDILEETNRERSRAGLESLSSNGVLERMAKQKLGDMFQNQYFSHISPTGISVETLALGFGYTYTVIGENLALGEWKSARDVMDSWMASPGHRANILKADFTEIGIAIGSGEYEGHKALIVVQEFGRP